MEHSESILALGFTIGSILSAVASGSVVLTGLFFPKLLLSRTRPFSEVFFFISLSDFLGSIGNCLGFPNFPLNGTINCTTQSFFRFFFFPASWLWAAALVYHLRCALISPTKKLSVTTRTLHLIIWPWCLILALLPLTTNMYGMDDETNGSAPCNYSGNVSTSLFWIYGYFIDEIVLVIIFTIFVIFRVIMRLSTGGDWSLPEIFLLRTAVAYPLALVVTWLPFVIFAWVALDIKRLQTTSNLFFFVGIIFSSQTGTALALIFYFTNYEARSKWAALTSRIFCAAVTQIPLLHESTVSMSIIGDSSADVEGLPSEGEDQNLWIDNDEDVPNHENFYCIDVPSPPRNTPVRSPRQSPAGSSTQSFSSGPQSVSSQMSTIQAQSNSARNSFIGQNSSI